MLIEELNSHFAKPVLSAGVLRVLVACEESQAVTKELRKLGHEAFSCDLLPESGGHPEWHLQHDVTDLLKLKWDMIIAFPPCTYLTNAGMCNLTRKGATDEYRATRLRLRDEAMEFAQMIYNNDCPLIAIENPVGYLNTGWRKPDQIINPYQFGDPFEKKTCLWLKGLPKLEPTNIVEPPKRTEFASGKSMPTWYADAWKLPKEERAKLRSKTFDGIANAMAVQWSSYACR